MNDTAEPKPKRGTGPLTAYKAAEKISAIIAESEQVFADVEAHVRAAVKQERANLQATITRIVLRVPEGEREKVAKLFLAAGQELRGFEVAVTVANDTEQGSDEPARPAWLDEPPPEPRAKPLVIDRSKGTR